MRAGRVVGDDPAGYVRRMALWRLTCLAVLMAALLPWGAFAALRPAPTMAVVQVQQGTASPAHRCRTGILPGCGQPAALLSATPRPARAMIARGPAAADLPLPQGRQPPIPVPPPRPA